jgi:hypothetical protein
VRMPDWAASAERYCSAFYANKVLTKLTRGPEDQALRQRVRATTRTGSASRERKDAADGYSARARHAAGRAQ